MRKDKVVSNYSKISDFELSTLAGRILKAMQDPLTVENFPSPTPTIEALDGLVTDYITKHEIASRRGSALQISQKNEARQALLDALSMLANYVNNIAKGQISLLLSTGMILAAQPAGSVIPLVTDRTRLRDGRISGQLRLDFAAVKGAWEYEIEIGEADTQGNVQWDRLVRTTSSRGNVLTDMVAGVKYYVRVRARNGKGTGDWSEATSIIAR